MNTLATTSVITELSDFHFAFQITHEIVFEVNYYRLGNNVNKHFSTSAAQFNQPKTDFNHCGQAQKELLKEGRKAMKFYNSWDYVHIQALTEDEHTQILQDIEILKAQYNYIELDHCARFPELRELSMMPLKKG